MEQAAGRRLSCYPLEQKACNIPAEQHMGLQGQLLSADFLQGKQHSLMAHTAVLDQIHASLNPFLPMLPLQPCLHRLADIS